MNLRKLDGKCIKIIDKQNCEYEGICSYNNKDYTYHEFGKDEESIQIANLLFYKSNIKKVESLENNRGPYGKFTQKYGTIEKMALEDGTDSIEEILTSEEPLHIYRLLTCIEDYLIKNEISYKRKLLQLLKEFNKYNEDEKTYEITKQIISKLENQN